MQESDFLSRNPVLDPEPVDLFLASEDENLISIPSEYLEIDYSPSREPQTTSSFEPKIKEVNLAELTTERFIVAQQVDPEIVKILEQLEKNELPPSKAHTYEVCDGVLFRKFQRNKKTLKAIYVPRDYRWAIVNKYHENFHHPGIDRTVAILVSKFWFTSMKHYVTKFINACVTCKLAKLPSGAKEIRFHPIPVPKSANASTAC